MNHASPALPEFSVSSSMVSAANSVAAAFHAYQESCFNLPKSQNVAEIKTHLMSLRERKQAYHLALKFLSTATLKENPAYMLNTNQQLTSAEVEQLQPLIDDYLEKRLNQLIRAEISQNPAIRNVADFHPVIAGPS